jgi:hypothetical protein
MDVPSSPVGGGVVSVELNSPRSSEMPETVGEVDDRSESTVRRPSDEVGESWFILTRTVAASSSWTCWCLEISNLEVYAHAGSCSHLPMMSTGGFEPCTHIAFKRNEDRNNN